MIEKPVLAGASKTHPAEKSIEVIKWLIENCSQSKERGIDPFLGSGSFAVACKELDRRCVGIERDNLWWYEALKRVKGEEVPG
jgi:DNA modification methylase